jgi:hypothetical protein
MAIFHLTAKTASRAGGQSAQAHFDYISRLGKYSNRDRDRLVFCESVNMPGWAAADSQKYWSSADNFERANGRLYKQLEFSLPIELPEKENVELALRFAKEVTNTYDGKLPFSIAIHEGRGHNPHVHLMVSERLTDGHDRTAESWFKRAATGKKLPSEGGAKKTDLLKPKEWLLMVRELWARLTNEALEANKKQSRIDHRSYHMRRIKTTPGKHVGPREFKYKRRPNIYPHVDLKSRDRQLEIIRTARELDELKRGAFDTSRQAAISRLRSKSPAPAQSAPVRKTQPSTPEM